MSPESDEEHPRIRGILFPLDQLFLPGSDFAFLGTIGKI